MTIPPDYRELLLRWGAARLGPFRLYGLRPVEELGPVGSIIEHNRHFREWVLGTDGRFFISEEGSGNPVGILPDGRIAVADHEAAGEVTIYAESLEEFVRALI